MVTTRTRELIKRDEAHVFHFFGVLPGIERIWERGEGVKLIDTDGKEFLDMCSVYQCCNLGYSRKELNDAAYEQMNKLCFMNTSVPYSNIPVIEYAEALAKFTPKSINHFLFCSGGSEAVESALKVAKAYWYFKGKASKYKVISLMDAYHGMFHLSGSLIGEPCGREAFGPEALGVVRIPSYHCYRCPFELKYPDCNIKCARFLETIIEAEGENSVAAFIAEPIHGFAGGVAPPPEYWPMVREICTKHNVLLIADEVMSGFCRTGKNFALDNWNVEPDIMTMGKGITGSYFPFGAVGASNQVYSAFLGQLFMHGMTNAGHPTGCAVAKAALDIYINEHISEHVAKVGNHVKERLEKEFLPLPCVGEISGLGLFLSIEIVADKETKRRFPPEANVMTGVIREQCLAKGFLPRVYSIGRRDRLFITPPLIITEEEADRGLDILYPIIAGLKPE